MNESPSVSSADHATFQAGAAGDFLVTTVAGFPVATTVSKTGALPSGVTFTPNGSDGAAIAGTPAAGTAGSYPIIVTVTNGASPEATQIFTLTVIEAPAITTNPASQSVNPGDSVTFTAAASGTPAPTVQWQRSTDAGTMFRNIAGATSPTYTFTAASGDTGNQYRAVFSNTVNNATTTAATETVNRAPAVTSADAVTFKIGTVSSFTVTTTGSPTAKLTIIGTLPDWVTFTDKGDSTAIISGTPPTGSAGPYRFTVNADNGTNPSASQAFTLTSSK